jgi:hypothetical protein
MIARLDGGVARSGAGDRGGAQDGGGELCARSVECPDVRHRHRRIGHVERRRASSPVAVLDHGSMRARWEVLQIEFSVVSKR